MSNDRLAALRALTPAERSERIRHLYALHAELQAELLAVMTAADLAGDSKPRASGIAQRDLGNDPPAA